MMNKRPKDEEPLEEENGEETLEQADLGISTSLPSGPVECLGMTFPSDEVRRAHFLKELAEKLKDPAFRKIEGFPIGEDEDILALSDPPYYTACPNPWLADFVNYYGHPYNPKEKYHRDPFTADVSEGKNHPIYTAHVYHTKVPHRAIMRYILHFTQPGDLVFDGFSGTGMTGVAAHLCGNKSEVESLGYRVKPNGIVEDDTGHPISKLGMRAAVLSDLSVIASFIAHNFNTPSHPADYLAKAEKALKIVKDECAWLFTTLHQATELDVALAVKRLSNLKSAEECRLFLLDTSALAIALEDASPHLQLGRINYVVWSDVFTCTECGGDIVFWDAAVDTDDWQVRDSFDCPHCRANVEKRKLDRTMVTFFDSDLGQTIKQAKNVPVLLHYKLNGETYHKKPDAFDFALLQKPSVLSSLNWFPKSRMIDGDESRRNDPIGLTHVHHFYTRRNLYTLAAFAKAMASQRNYVNLTSVAMVATKMYRFRSQGSNLGAGGGPLSGTLYVPSLCKEIPIIKMLDEHIRKTAQVRVLLDFESQSIVQTASSTSIMNCPSNSVDYIFLDPPFGGNLMYTELNFIWESWLKVLTAQRDEAVTSKTQSKKLGEYQKLMVRCFHEFFRVLKPGRWITVEFSNTQSTVWNALQTTMQEAGFVIASVAALDKKQMSYKAVNTPTAVKQDLVLSAYKPNGGLEERFAQSAETEAGVWDFIHTHLGNLPVVKPKGGQLEPIIERDPRILFDRTVAFYVRHSIPVPISSPQFQAALAEKFPERDGMYFLPDQAAEYDKVRMKMEGIGQLSIWVEDERSAVDWLRNYLKRKPSKYQDVQPEFFEQLSQSWKKWETKPELRALLDQYFLCYHGEGEIPSQIHSYLSTNFKELRNLPPDHALLRDKARDCWFVPDPRKNADVEQLREKRLLEEFWSYLPPGYQAAAKTRKPNEPMLPGLYLPPPKLPKGKRITIVRTEAIRVGFNFCFARNDYTTIIAVAQYIPDDVIQNDEQLQMLYDSAVTRTEGVPE